MKGFMEREREGGETTGRWSPVKKSYSSVE
jgi:hypothetical protein